MTTTGTKRFATLPWEHATIKPTFRAPSTEPFFPAGDPRNDHEGLVPSKLVPSPQSLAPSQIVAIPGLKPSPSAQPRTSS